MQGIKYGLLFLPRVARDDNKAELRELAPDLVTWRGKLVDFIEPGETNHWKQWLGELEWSRHEKEQRIVMAFASSERAEVLDAENQTLGGRVSRAWFAMLLAPPVMPFHGKARYIGGQVLTMGSPPRLKSVREQGKAGRVQRPLYASREEFYKGLRSQSDDPWLERWAEWIVTVDHVFDAGIPPILDMALFAFRTAHEQDMLEFSIPEYVRAAECILALPRGTGGKLFAERAMKLAPELAGDAYIGVGLEQRMLDLYQHRSDCVHGKLAFRNLREMGEAGIDEAARFEYLAETLARRALNVGFTSTKQEMFREREILERAWANQQFP